MSRESEVGGPVSVSNGDVTVEKSFVADEFPVPAIKFQITSESGESQHVRIVDQIPDEFPMEGVGFHPDYESDNWAAYKDHRVEYERTLAPNEEVVTVYGIRLDQVSEAESFLVEPVLERPPAPQDGEAPDRDDGVEDILGEDRSQLVRDALQGNGSLAEETDAVAAEDAASAVLQAEADEGADPLADPVEDAEDTAVDVAVEAESEASAADVEAALEQHDVEGEEDADVEGSVPRELATEATPAITRSGEADTDAAETVETEGSEAEHADAAAKTTDTDDYVDVEDAVEADAPDEDTVDDDAPAAAAVSGSLATTLAAELRSGDVPEEDLELLRSELDLGIPRSADVRIRRLQAQMDDLQAYSDALAEFIDEEGTGQELVDGLRREVASLDEQLDSFGEELSALDAEVTAADAEREDLRDDLSTLEGDLAAVDERVEDTAQRVGEVDDQATEAIAGVEELNTTLDEELGAVREDIDELSNDLSQTASAAAGLDEELGDVREDIADLDGEIVSTRESLEGDVEEVRSELAELEATKARVDSIEDDIETLMQFRDRLNDAFGPGE